MKTTTSYTDIVLNAFKSVQAWRTTTLLLLGAVVFETLFIGWLASQRTVILIPQHMPNIKAPISLQLGEPFSPDYLSAIGRGDIFALLNWTPENIEGQYGLFLGRLSSGLHDAQKEVLLTEAKMHKENGLTQSFYVTRSFVKDALVTFSGVLVRSSGGKEVFRGPATYAIQYTNAGNSLLLITAVTQPSAAPSP